MSPLSAPSSASSISQRMHETHFGSPRLRSCLSLGSTPSSPFPPAAKRCSTPLGSTQRFHRAAWMNNRVLGSLRRRSARRSVAAWTAASSSAVCDGQGLWKRMLARPEAEGAQTSAPSSSGPLDGWGTQRDGLGVGQEHSLGTVQAEALLELVERAVLEPGLDDRARRRRRGRSGAAQRARARAGHAPRRMGLCVWEGAAIGMARGAGLGGRRRVEAS